MANYTNGGSVKRVLQTDIAEALGVSVCTVAKVLNHDPNYRVAPDTSASILKAAREMGYQSRKRLTGNIAFVVCGPMASSEVLLHRATCAEAARQGKRVFLVNMPAYPTLRQIQTTVNPLTADGVVLLCAFDHEVAIQLSRIMAVVTTVGPGTLPEVDTVYTDDTILAKRLTERLIDRGHKRIAFVVHSLENTYAVAGYVAAHEEHSLELDHTLIREKEHRRYSQLLGDLMKRTPPPTALLACTTMDHPVILTTLDCLGINVPDDLSYVGWACDQLSSLSPFPVITCLDDLFESLARGLVRRLLSRVENPHMEPAAIAMEVNIRAGATDIAAKGEYAVTEELVGGIQSR